MLQSVLTGNTEVNALAKLVAFELDQWIDIEVGAFGSDHADRTELVPIALARALRGPGSGRRPAPPAPYKKLIDPGRGRA